MTIAAYLPVVQCGYVWDDDAYVRDNQTLRSADGFRQIWCDIRATPQYYPLVHTTYWIEYRLWGLNPMGYHVVNVLLHAVGALLLWRVLVVLQIPGAWVAASVFALHPVHVESVAWITERKNVLSGVFYLSAAMMYLRYVSVPKRGSGNGRSSWFYAASLGLFVCALLSKTVTCTLPAVLLLLRWWKHRRVGWPDVRALVPFFAVGIAFGLLTVWTEKNRVGAVGEEWNIAPIDRFLISGRALWFYACKLLWPGQLMFVYPRWQIDATAWLQYLYPLAAIGVMAGLWVGRARMGKGPLVAVLCFAGTLFPALGFFDVYPMRYSFVADHFQYLASIGLIVLVVGAGGRVAWRLRGGGKGIATVALACVLATFGTLTWRQTHAYTNLESLWRDTLRKNPDAWLAENNLGTTLAAQDKLDEAIVHLRRALQIKPAYAKAHKNLGGVLARQGKADEAISHYHHALQLEPDYAEAHNSLGITLTKQGKLDEAIIHFRRSLQIESRFAGPHNNLGVALLSQGNLDEAIPHFRQALRLNPADPEARHNLDAILRFKSETEQ